MHCNKKNPTNPNPSDHQIESITSFRLCQFLEILCNIYGLLQVWRVGWQHPRSQSKCALVLLNLLHGKQDLPTSTTVLGAAWALLAQCVARRRCGLTALGSIQCHDAIETSFTCTSTTEPLQQDLWDKLVRRQGSCTASWGPQGSAAGVHCVLIHRGTAPWFTSEYMRN